MWGVVFIAPQSHFCSTFTGGNLAGDLFLHLFACGLLYILQFALFVRGVSVLIVVMISVWVSEYQGGVPANKSKRGGKA